jgi:hypothetical protein
VKPLLVLSLVTWCVALGLAQRRDVFVASRNDPAIAYDATPTTDAVAQLNRRIQDGSATLAFEPSNGYLRSILDALKVPIDSQSFVFSQTSSQAPLIDMRNPRAVYFNDTIAVGWVRTGDVLEVAALDPRQGMVFYSLDQKRATKPQFVRSEQCLGCHLSWDTLGVPGLMVLSTLPRPDENAYANGFVTDHRSPFGERWSGWYVTGNPGARHLGNIPVTPAELKRGTIASPTRPVKSLDGVIDLKGYPTPHSDVVALMVLAHQTHMTNLLTRIGWEARLAARGGADAAARVREAAVDVVDYMLFVDEAPLTAKVEGFSGFAERFAAQGPRDTQGRSLRQLDLTRRLMRYSCSYMIYSDAFDALPPLARDAIFARMKRVLSGDAQEPKYKALSPADRQAVLEILRATKKNLPASFAS